MDIAKCGMKYECVLILTCEWIFAELLDINSWVRWYGSLDDIGSFQSVRPKSAFKTSLEQFFGKKIKLFIAKEGAKLEIVKIE